jgi:hypothetical protein
MMPYYAFDREQCILLVLTQGKSTPNNYEQLYQSYLILDQEAVSRNQESLSILLLEPGAPSPRPDASWRKRFAEIRLHVKAKRRLTVLVTDSMIIRGVMTVINWIQPKPDNEEHLTVTTLDEAIPWIEARRGPSRQLIEDLLQKARLLKKEALDADIDTKPSAS